MLVIAYRPVRDNHPSILIIECSYDLAINLQKRNVILAQFVSRSQTNFTDVRQDVMKPRAGCYRAVSLRQRGKSKGLQERWIPVRIQPNCMTVTYPIIQYIPLRG